MTFSDVTCATSAAQEQGALSRVVILAAIIAKPNSGLSELAEATGLSYDTVRRQTPKLTSDGLVQLKKQGRRKIYRVTRTGIARFANSKVLQLAGSKRIGTPDR
jgi:DNA-binding transcriptional ArsR family regulator